MRTVPRPSDVRIHGWIADRDPAYVVVTYFKTLGPLPLWPLRSERAERATLHVDSVDLREAVRHPWVNRIHLRGAPIPRNARSIAAAYLRTWGLFFMVAGVVGMFPLGDGRALHWLGLAAYSLAMAAARTRPSLVRYADAIELAALAIFGAEVWQMNPPLLDYVWAALVVPIALSLGFVHSAAIPMAIARPIPLPATPRALVPLPSVAPEIVSPTTDRPTLLT